MKTIDRDRLEEEIRGFAARTDLGEVVTAREGMRLIIRADRCRDFLARLAVAEDPDGARQLCLAALWDLVVLAK